MTTIEEERIDNEFQKEQQQIEDFLGMHNKTWGELLEDDEGRYVLVEDKKVYFTYDEDYG